jgi:hypothetical protein
VRHSPPAPGQVLAVAEDSDDSYRQEYPCRWASEEHAENDQRRQGENEHPDNVESPPHPLQRELAARPNQAEAAWLTESLIPYLSRIDHAAWHAAPKPPPEPAAGAGRFRCMLVAETNTVGPYATAAIAAGAVIAGGLITAGTTFVVERQRHKHADETQAVADHRELRQAVRIVLDEYASATRALLDTSRRDRELSDAAPLPIGAWVDNRIVLAGFLSDEAWMWGTMANRRIADLNDARDAGAIVADPEMRAGYVTVTSAMGILESELATKTGATRSGIYQYTGYASADEVWPEGHKPRGG